MKIVFSFLLLLAVCSSTLAQRISKVTITGNGTFEMISVQTDDAVINVSPEGNVISYGVEYLSERIPNYSRIEPYTGRVDLFGAYDDKSFRGKIKYLGKAAITYYASYDAEILQGKIKSIGPLVFNYNMQYDDEAYRGKIKSVGNTALGYFSNFDNKALKGKLKTVGFTELNYYTAFDDKAYSGKIKSIGPAGFTYYSSYDIKYAGSLKSGQQLQNLNGISYLIKF